MVDLWVELRIVAVRPLHRSFWGGSAAGRTAYQIRLGRHHVIARPNIRRSGGPLLAAVLFLSFLFIGPGFAATRAKVATDAGGNLVKVDGSIVLVEPDIELSVVTAGGLQEPRKEWSDTARRLFPKQVRTLLAGRNVELKPDYNIGDGLDPASRLGQIVRLNEAVAMSITQYSQPGSALATKRDARGKPRMDWSLGPGVAVLRKATGADYALFTYVRDSYTSGGRAALRVAGFLLLGGDIGGGAQVGVSTLVDLRTGQVVWYNLLAKQTGDLRDEKGAQKTVQQLLHQLPL